jgi:hypothetical protein
MAAVKTGHLARADSGGEPTKTRIALSDWLAWLAFRIFLVGFGQSEQMPFALAHFSFPVTCK